MMSQTVNVLLTGELLHQQSMDESVAVLSKLFKVDGQQAAKMLAKTPLVIKKNVDLATAERFVTVLHRSGFGALIESIASPAADTPTAPELPVTPAPVPFVQAVNEQQRLAESLDFQLVIPTASQTALPDAVPSTPNVPAEHLETLSATDGAVSSVMNAEDAEELDENARFGDGDHEPLDYSTHLMTDAFQVQNDAGPLNIKTAAFVVEDPLAPWEPPVALSAMRHLENELLDIPEEDVPAASFVMPEPVFHSQPDDLPTSLQLMDIAECVAPDPTDIPLAPEAQVVNPFDVWEPLGSHSETLVVPAAFEPLSVARELEANPSEILVEAPQVDTLQPEYVAISESPALELGTPIPLVDVADLGQTEDNSGQSTLVSDPFSAWEEPLAQVEMQDVRGAASYAPEVNDTQVMPAITLAELPLAEPVVESHSFDVWENHSLQASEALAPSDETLVIQAPVIEISVIETPVMEAAVNPSPVIETPFKEAPAADAFTDSLSFSMPPLGAAAESLTDLVEQPLVSDEDPPVLVLDPFASWDDSAPLTTNSPKTVPLVLEEPVVELGMTGVDTFDWATPDSTASMPLAFSASLDKQEPPLDNTALSLSEPIHPEGALANAPAAPLAFDAPLNASLQPATEIPFVSEWPVAAVGDRVETEVSTPAMVIQDPFSRWDEGAAAASEMGLELSLDKSVQSSLPLEPLAAENCEKDSTPEEPLAVEMGDFAVANDNSGECLVTPSLEADVALLEEPIDIEVVALKEAEPILVSDPFASWGQASTLASSHLDVVVPESRVQSGAVEKSDSSSQSPLLAFDTPAPSLDSALQLSFTEPSDTPEPNASLSSFAFDDSDALAGNASTQALVAEGGNFSAIALEPVSLGFDEPIHAAAPQAAVNAYLIEEPLELETTEEANGVGFTAFSGTENSDWGLSPLTSAPVTALPADSTWDWALDNEPTAEQAEHISAEVSASLQAIAHASQEPLSQEELEQEPLSFNASGVDIPTAPGLLDTSWTEPNEEQAFAEVAAAPFLPPLSSPLAPEVEDASSALSPAKADDWAFSVDAESGSPVLAVSVPAGETLRVEARSATARDGIQVRKPSGMPLMRMLSSKQLAICEMQAREQAGQIVISPAVAGELVAQSLVSMPIFLRTSCFVAATAAVVMDAEGTAVGRELVSADGASFMYCSGAGQLWFSAAGRLVELDVQKDYLVNLDNLVAFSAGLTCDMHLAERRSGVFGGRKWICRFSGEGKVWVQTQAAAGEGILGRLRRITQG